jgi:long-chain acyl-CoA synthetase
VLSPIIEMRFVSPAGQVLPAGDEGEIQLRGVTVTPGYWNLDETSNSSFTDDGWLHTGDIGRVDNDGFLYVTGRIKEMAIRGGENIYPIEIENAAYRHPAVKEAAAFGVPDTTLGEELAIVCHLQPGATLTENGLRAHLRELLAHFKVPKYITFSPTPLPRNMSEKLHRLELRRRHIAQSVTDRK